jgi:hypothetical protein
VSLTQGLASPRTPLRQFLDRELSAGPRRLRATYRAMLAGAGVLLPGDGVGFEAGTVGTAIDQRLRLAFTCAEPVDAATLVGVANLQLDPAQIGAEPWVWEALAPVGVGLVERLRSTIAALALDDRAEPMTRAENAEERLARMLLVAVWCALNYRNPIAFPLTPLFQAAWNNPTGLTLEAALAIPHQGLVDDLLAQLHLAEDGPLAGLRDQTTPEVCVPGPVFDGSADMTGDADLIADGVLIDVKSTRNVHHFPLPVAWQLLGYTLMDYRDRYRIDQVGLYLSRAGVLAAWPLEDYLALLGARRRDLAELRWDFRWLLQCPEFRADLDPLPEQMAAVHRRLADTAPEIDDESCRVCGQPLGVRASRGRRRLYCSMFCARRANTLRRRGWLECP